MAGITEMKRAAAIGIVLCTSTLMSSAQASEFASFELRVDRTEERDTKTVSMGLDEFMALSKMAKACIDVAVWLDGKSEYEVMFSTESQNTRDNVACVPDGYGPLPMGDGVEYYVRSESKEGRMDLSVLPGSRSLNPYNDVVCVPGGSIDSRFDGFAAVRIRGFYTVLVNDFGEFSVVQLRPVVNPPTDEQIETCVETFK